MNRIVLVAARDYRQLTTTRAFWIALLIIPLALTVTIAATLFFRPPPSTAYVLVDESGRNAPAIERRLEQDYQETMRDDLAAYRQRWSAVAHAPAFQPSPRPFVRAAPPPGVPTGEGADRFGAAMAPFLGRDVATAQGRLSLSLAVYIPRNYGAPGVVPRLWSNGRASTDLIETIRSELTRSLRHEALQANGVAPDTAARIEALEAPLDVDTGPARRGGAPLIIRSALPLALVYLLIMTAIITGNMILQGLIEERSNRLLESVLACIRPGQLLYGKLLGLCAVGLTIMAVWVGCALGAVFAVPGAADMVLPSLGAMNHAWMIAAALFYFLSAYLIISMIFLAIGSLSNSMQDASAYLMPVIMIIMLPVVFMMTSAIRNPDGLFPRILSWIPLYTPYAMLARLSSGVSLFEILGTGILLVAFVALELVLLGRVFRASLLGTGQPPNLLGFCKLMLRPPPN